MNGNVILDRSFANDDKTQQFNLKTIYYEFKETNIKIETYL